MKSERELPEVDGHWDPWFDVAVMAFQRKHAHLLVGEPPGQILPVSKTFTLEDGDRWPTILLLNQFAEDATGIQINRLMERSEGQDKGFPYPTSMLIMFPQLRKQLK